MKVAILLTVYNRKNVTIKALTKLTSILQKDKKRHYEIYMTNDGCTDGTPVEVQRLFPTIHIINHSGNLYWCGGMNLAWSVSLEQQFDYYIWFNDDAMLNDKALNLLFQPIEKFGNMVIVCGAFKSMSGIVSYGGKDRRGNLIEPNGVFKEIHYMNGNWVLISQEVFLKLGMIDSMYTHSLGDWDYVLRARKMGIKVFLTGAYVGSTDRHDDEVLFCRRELSLKQRIQYLYSPKYSVIASFRFKRRHLGLFKAIFSILASHLYILFPFLYKIRIGCKSKK